MITEASVDSGAIDGTDANPPVMAVRWISPWDWTPSDAEISILIPFEHTALTVVHRVDGSRERRAFVRAPMVAVLPPGEPCRVFSQRTGETLALTIASSYFARHARVAMCETRLPRLTAHYAAVDPFLREIGNALCDDLHSGRQPNEAYLLPFAGVIATHLVRHYCGALPGATVGAGLPQHKLKRVQAFVDEHLAETLHVHQLAAVANISAFHFARMFKGVTGQSPHQYVVTQRVEFAKALLRDGEMPLIVVAQQAGFRTQGHFTGVFRRYTGCTPRLYRLGCRDEQTAATDGPALLRAMPDDAAMSTVPVTLASARAGDEHLAAGGHDYLPKPIAAQELRDRSDEADGMPGLHQLGQRLLATKGLQPMLEEVLDAIISLHGADFGYVQLQDLASGDLTVMAQRNLPREFLACCGHKPLKGGGCGRSLGEGPRAVDDVTTDAAFEPYRVIAARTGVRAVQSTPLIGHAGEPLGMISTLFRQPHRLDARELCLTELYARHAADAIERTRAEDALHQARDQLAQATRVAAMCELAAEIAHEVNQPLAAVVANGHAAAHWLAAQPPNLEEASLAVARVVSDGLRGGLVLDRMDGLWHGKEIRTPVDLLRVLREVAAIVDDEARRRGVRLGVESLPEAATVLADPVQIQQVVLNLVMNGFEAMDTVPPSRRTLALALDQHGGQTWRVSVRDAGIGLKPGERDRVFDVSYTTKPSGMGIGLAICRSIVQGHGGRLWCTANDVGGETFSFTLPR